MHLFTTSLLLTSALCAAAVPTTTSAAAAPPQYSYPAIVNSTNPRSGYLTVQSSDPKTNGRNVQLRQATDSKAQITVIDASSPVLLFQMRDGVIYWQNRNLNNQPNDMGPTASLKNISTTATSSLQELSFANATKSHPSTPDFYLTDVSTDGVYQLYHDVHEDLIVNGFTLCPRDDYFQLFYYTYNSQNPPNFGKGCEYVAVQTVVAPVVPW